MRKEDTSTKLSWTIGLIVTSLCIMALLAAAALTADTHTPPGPDGIPGEPQKNPAPETRTNTPNLPPDEAIASCAGKSAGDTCQFTDREGLSTGVCDDKPGVLACAPERARTTGQLPAEKPAPQSINTPPGTTQTANAQTSRGTAGAADGAFSITSDAGPDGGTMPVEYSCDGAGSTPALSWSGAPEGTKEFALMVTTIPVDGSTRWNWVLYGIPATATRLIRNSSGVGITGTGSHGTVMMYDPPCPQGPGVKVYTFTLYALSASPTLPGSADQVTGQVLTSAISSITLGKASLNLRYDRS